MMDEISNETKSHYTAMRELPDGRVCGVHRLLFHWTMHIGISNYGYEERYCYQTEKQAIDSMMAWDGTGDPPGDWHKHPDSGRRRDPFTGEIWHESQYRV
jgi:hypothetical protein